MRETAALAAFVVSVVFMVIGVAYGLGGDHATALPAVVVSLLALGLGTTLLRK